MEKARICILMPKDLNEDLKQIAEEQELSKNKVIQIALRKYVHEYEEQK